MGRFPIVSIEEIQEACAAAANAFMDYLNATRLEIRKSGPIDEDYGPAFSHCYTHCEIVVESDPRWGVQISQVVGLQTEVFQVAVAAHLRDMPLFLLKS